MRQMDGFRQVVRRTKKAHAIDLVEGVGLSFERCAWRVDRMQAGYGVVARLAPPALSLERSSAEP